MRPRAKGLSFQRTAIVVGLLCLFVIGLVAFQIQSMKGKWRERSSDVVEQVNALGTTLQPGDIGVIHVLASDADELVLLPAWCPETDLRRRFSDRPTAFVDHLLTLSRDEGISPALIWLRNRRILSINRADFGTAINTTLQSWELDGPREMSIRKELQSPNGFLSLEFVEENKDE